MSPFAASPTGRRLAAATALAAITALVLGFCICEMPKPRATQATEAAGECHEAGDAPAQPSLDGAWSSECCCAGDPQLQMGMLEARAPQSQRTASLPGAGSFATRAPALDRADLQSAPPWLVAASPPHAPPPAFVLPLRV